jgi:hypothetical protein
MTAGRLRLIWLEDTENDLEEMDAKTNNREEQESVMKVAKVLTQHRAKKYVSA